MCYYYKIMETNTVYKPFKQFLDYKKRTSYRRLLTNENGYIITLQHKWIYIARGYWQCSDHKTPTKL